MKKYLFLLLFFAPASILFSQPAYEKEPFLVRSLSGDGIKNVEARTSGGSISVMGVTGSEARIEVFISPNNYDGKTTVTKEELKQRLEELYDLNITVINNKLTAVAKSKSQIKDWTKSLNVSYRIYVPQNISTDLVTSGGSIRLDNLSGSQSFATSGGSLHLSKLSGKVDGRTSGGSVHLEDSRDEIELSTSGGGIYATNSSGNLRLSTSGGSLDLSRLKGTIRASTSGGSIKGNSIEGELRAHTSGGNVRLNDLSCSLETGTSGGSIQVSFTQLGKYVRISNSAGNIDLSVPKNAGMDLDLSGRIGRTGFQNFNGKIDDRQVTGKLNGGGVPVVAETSAGRITFSLQ
jgi:DUF4097 and DUF4098 domain-containing protein YvlB